MLRRHFLTALCAVTFAFLAGIASPLFAAEATGAEKSGILPYLQNPAPDGMTVCFLSLNVTEVTVLWNKGDAAPATKVTATALKIPKTTWTIWKARITGLTPGAKYSYKVIHNENGTEKTSAVYSFTTLNPKLREMRAVAFNDVHDKIPVLEALLKHVKPTDYDFTLLLGDMWNDPSSSKNATRVFNTMEAYVRLLDASNKPMLYMRGNHDVRGNFAGYLSYLFDLPHNDPTAKFADQNAYYDFRVGPVWFIGPDCGEDFVKRIEIFGPYRDRQTIWLKNLFAKNAEGDAPWRVIATHIPLYNDNIWDSGDSREKWEPILADKKIDVMIAGHDHGWKQLVKGKTYTVTRNKGKSNEVTWSSTPPYPVLIGGGPNMKGREVGTVMIMKADAKNLKIDLVSVEGKTLSKVNLKK